MRQARQTARQAVLLSGWASRAGSISCLALPICSFFISTIRELLLQGSDFASADPGFRPQSRRRHFWQYRCPCWIEAPDPDGTRT